MSVKSLLYDAIPQCFGMTGVVLNDTVRLYTQLVIPTKEESHKELKELA
jgi:hypothetical protein